jgi:mitogen-activated protein kinase kinase kinase kinase 3/mitogen-activated protein kinase kinase kinase kinase 2
MLSSSLSFSQHIDIRLPDPLPIFELLVLVTDEFPQLCVGVRDCTAEKGKPPTNQQLKFDIVELNGTPNSSPGGTEMFDARISTI